MTFDARTALIVVDMQNDFVDPNGTLHVTGAEDIIAAAVEAMREAGVTLR